MSGSSGHRRTRSKNSGRDADRPSDPPAQRPVARDELSWNDAPALPSDDVIEAMFERTSSTYYELLGVPRDALPSAIAAAFASLTSRFDPRHFAGRVSTRRMFQVEAIARALQAAVSTLTEPICRASYDGAIERGEVGATADKRSGIKHRVNAHTPPPRSITPGGVERAISEPPPSRASERASERALERVPERASSGAPEPSRPLARVVVTDTVRTAPTPRRDLPVGEPGTPGTLLRVVREELAFARDGQPQRSNGAERKPDPDEVVARRHEVAGQWRLAVAAWRAVCERRHEDPWPHLALANAACKGHVELELACQYARVAVRLAPESADAEATLARALMLEGSVAGARHAVMRALSLDPSNAAALDLARRLKA